MGSRAFEGGVREEEGRVGIDSDEVGSDRWCGWFVVCCLLFFKGEEVKDGGGGCCEGKGGGEGDGEVCGGEGKRVTALFLTVSFLVPPWFFFFGAV